MGNDMTWLEIVRGLIRPLITANIVAMVWYLLVHDKIDEKVILSLMSVVVTFYFVERAINKAKNGNGGN